MGSELDDALRAAKAKAKMTSSTPSPSAVVVVAAASPGRKKNKNKNKNKRRRKASRSDSMASESAGDSDPAARIAAFKQRMFDVGNDAASATFASDRKPSDEMVQVQWKTTQKKGGRGRSYDGKDSDDEVVPQLTRTRVVAKPREKSVQAPAVVAPTNKKKRMQNKKGAEPIVHELKVPATAAPAQVAAALPATVTARRDDDALDFSDPSDDDADAATDAGQAMTQHRTGTQAMPATKAQGVSRVLQNKAAVAVVPAKATGKVTKSPAINKAVNGRTGTAPKGKTLLPTPTPTTAAKPLPRKSIPVTLPTASPSSAVDTASADDDPWDLDALVKNTVKKAKQQRPVKTAISDDDDDDHDDDALDDHAFVGKTFRQHQLHLFSQLIDDAAREQWELIEVGRLVRLFAAQWNHKSKKTARFLRRYCPELVSVDFLEGLNIPLTCPQLLKIFERGSGSPAVVLNKIASALENGSLSVRDEALQSFIADHTQRLATNREVVEYLLPLLESLSKVKDVGVLLKTVCAHWHIDRTAALVQEVLLTPVFDDLDGQPDVILEDLPALEGRLDFPSCMDDEDADEDGNLKGLIAGEESDLGESDADSEDLAEDALAEVLSDDADGDDSHAEDDVYEGETDSEEERAAQERLNPVARRRSRFILDEADEDEDDDDDEDGGFIDKDDDDDEEDSGDSSSDEENEKPQRKRLRKG